MIVNRLSMHISFLQSGQISSIILHLFIKFSSSLISVLRISQQCLGSITTIYWYDIVIMSITINHIHVLLMYVNIYIVLSRYINHKKMNIHTLKQLFACVFVGTTCSTARIKPTRTNLEIFWWIFYFSSEKFSVYTFEKKL